MYEEKKKKKTKENKEIRVYLKRGSRASPRTPQPVRHQDADFSARVRPCAARLPGHAGAPSAQNRQVQSSTGELDFFFINYYSLVLFFF